MFLFLYRTIKLVANAVFGRNSPGQVGLSIALGMLIGLIPNDSLLTLVVAALVFGTSVNLLTTAVAACCFMWIGLLLDPVTHQLGHFVLTYPGLQSSWLWLYEQPVIPWTRFNNTVVMGSFLVGLFCFYPVYLVSKLLLIKYSRRLNFFSVRSWLYKNLPGKKKLANLTGAEE